MGMNKRVSSICEQNFVTGSFICSVIRDNFLVFIRKQPLHEVHKWANPSKMWVSPLIHRHKVTPNPYMYMDNKANFHVLSFFKERLNFKVLLKRR